MRSKKISVNGRVTLSIEIEVPVESWGGDCSMHQVEKQSLDAAEHAMTWVLKTLRDASENKELDATTPVHLRRLKFGGAKFEDMVLKLYRTGGS